MKACAIFIDRPLSYQAGLLLQGKILEARIQDLIPDTVLFLQHLPVITCGVRSKPEQILVSNRELKARNIDISRSSRGGAATYHGPGQLIMYPIIKLVVNKTDAHGYLYNLEEIALRTAADFGVKAFRRRGMTGAWTDEGKLAAIGIRFKRWVTYHGMSFNVKPDLSGFSTIVPCGLAGEKITSLKLLLGDKCPSLKKTRECMANHFSSVCARDLTVIHRKHYSASQLPGLLAILR